MFPELQRSRKTATPRGALRRPPEAGQTPPAPGRFAHTWPAWQLARQPFWALAKINELLDARSGACHIINESMKVPMTPKQRRRLLLDLDLSVTNLAHAAGVTRPAASSTLSGARQTPLIRRRLLAQLCTRRPSLTYASLWDGKPDPGIDHLPRGRRSAGSVTPVHQSPNGSSKGKP